MVQAALDILEEEGPDGLTVHGVVDRADSSVGSFYARFGGKDDLLEYLASRVWDEALERWNAAVEARSWSDMDLAEITEGAVGLLVDVRRTRVGYLRDLDRLSGGGDAYERFRRHLLASLETLLLERRSEMQHPNPQLAVRLGLGAVLGVIDTGPDGVGRDVLIPECTQLLLAYLSSETELGGEPVEFFDVWG
jgi:AcrR family transcriptional regulator